MSKKGKPHPEWTGPSKSRVDKAGKIVRGRDSESLFGPVPTASREEWAQSFFVIDEFRSQWYSASRPPLTSISMGLRSFAKTIGLDAGSDISQRLKRTERIIDKLNRYPSMRLSQMEDVGGCRVVVGSSDDLSRFAAYIRRSWKKNLVNQDDYIATPKPTGYRSLHLIVERRRRLVEFQLRTSVQHAWAVSMERLESRTMTRLREGDGDADLREWMRVLADALAARDGGERVGPTAAKFLTEGFSRFGPML